MEKIISVEIVEQSKKPSISLNNPNIDTLLLCEAFPCSPSSGAVDLFFATAKRHKYTHVSSLSF
jgi:hypothetical protein